MFENICYIFIFNFVFIEGIFTYYYFFYKLFVKANKPGWTVFIPVYKTIVLLEIVELPRWYLILLFVPFGSLYIVLKIYIRLAHKFGVSSKMGVLAVIFPRFSKFFFRKMVFPDYFSKHLDFIDSHVYTKKGLIRLYSLFILLFIVAIIVIIYLININNNHNNKVSDLFINDKIINYI